MKLHNSRDLGQGLVRMIRFYDRNTSKHFIGPWVTVPLVLQWYNLELFYNLSALYKDTNNISVKIAILSIYIGELIIKDTV